MALAALIERGSAGYNPMAAANPMGGGMGGGMPMGLGGGGGGGLGSGMSIPGLDSLSSLTGLGRDHHHDSKRPRPTKVSHSPTPNPPVPGPTANAPRFTEPWTSKASAIRSRAPAGKPE